MSRPTREELMAFIGSLAVHGSERAIVFRDREDAYQKAVAACRAGVHPGDGDRFRVHHRAGHWCDTSDGGLAVIAMRHAVIPIDAPLLPFVRQHSDHEFVFYGNGVDRQDDYGMVSFLSGGASDREAPTKVVHAVCATCLSEVR